MNRKLGRREIAAVIKPLIEHGQATEVAVLQAVEAAGGCSRRTLYNALSELNVAWGGDATGKRLVDKGSGEPKRVAPRSTASSTGSEVQSDPTAAADITDWEAADPEGTALLLSLPELGEAERRVLFDWELAASKEERAAAILALGAALGWPRFGFLVSVIPDGIDQGAASWRDSVQREMAKPDVYEDGEWPTDENGKVLFHCGPQGMELFFGYLWRLVKVRLPGVDPISLLPALPPEGQSKLERWTNFRARRRARRAERGADAA